MRHGLGYGVGSVGLETARLHPIHHAALAGALNIVLGEEDVSW